MIADQEWQKDTIAVLERVFEERKRQVARYGHNEDLEDGTGPGEDWIPVLNLNAEHIEQVFREDYVGHEEIYGRPTWMHLVREEVAEAFKEKDPERLVAELEQVAALAVSWIEKIEKREQR